MHPLSSLRMLKNCQRSSASAGILTLSSSAGLALEEAVEVAQVIITLAKDKVTLKARRNAENAVARRLK